MSMKDVMDAISVLRAEGYAVVGFSPEELGGLYPFEVEDVLVSWGFEVIEDLKAHKEAGTL